MKRKMTRTNPPRDKGRFTPGHHYPSPTNALKYEPWMCDRVVEIMKDGSPLHSVALELGINYVTLFEWRQKYVEFDNACLMGMLHSFQWWITKAMENLKVSKDEKVSQAVWIFVMKNLFRWSDRLETQIQAQATREKIFRLVYTMGPNQLRLIRALPQEQRNQFLIVVGPEGKRMTMEEFIKKVEEEGGYVVTGTSDLDPSKKEAKDVFEAEFGEIDPDEDD